MSELNLLRRYSSHRSTFFDAVKLPQAILRVINGCMFHLILPLGALMIVIAVFKETKKLTLFSLHPVCMTIGIVIFIGEGICTYHNSSIVDALAPIMEAPKKNKARSFHRAVQYIGAFFMCAGMLAILAHKFSISKSFFPSTVHSLIAVLTIASIFVQFYSGTEKMNSLTKIRRWHGNAGLLAWDLLVLTMLLGMYELFHMKFINLFAAMALSVVWAVVHLQFRGGEKKPDPEGTQRIRADSELLIAETEDSV